MDDHLLRAARWAGLLWCVGAVIAFSSAAAEGRSLVQPFGLALLWLSAPLGLAAAGSRLRRRENRAWALHRLVDDHVEVPVSELLRDSDYTGATLERAIKDLNNSGLAFLVWDRDADVLQDGRLRGKRVQIECCGACGAKVTLTLTIGDVASARCPYCHDALGASELIEEKARLIEELDTDPIDSAPRRGDPSGFSVGILLVLAVVFWPAAAAYAFYHWNVSR